MANTRAVYARRLTPVPRGYHRTAVSNRAHSCEPASSHDPAVKAKKCLLLLLEIIASCRGPGLPVRRCHTMPCHAMSACTAVQPGNRDQPKENRALQGENLLPGCPRPSQSATTAGVSHLQAASCANVSPPWQTGPNRLGRKRGFHDRHSTLRPNQSARPALRFRAFWLQEVSSPHDTSRGPHRLRPSRPPRSLTRDSRTMPQLSPAHARHGMHVVPSLALNRESRVRSHEHQQSVHLTPVAPHRLQPRETFTDGMTGVEDHVVRRGVGLGDRVTALNCEIDVRQRVQDRCG